MLLFTIVPTHSKKNTKASKERPKSNQLVGKIQSKNRLITLPASVSDIFQWLPQTNCKVCGFISCEALALKANNDPSIISACPPYGYYNLLA